MAVTFDNVLADNEDKKIPVEMGNALPINTQTETTTLPDQKETITANDLRTQVQAEQDDKEKTDIAKEIVKSKGFLGSLNDFGTYVGQSLEKFATNFPNKVEEAYNDPKRRFALMYSLKSISEGGRLKRLEEARSPLAQLAFNVEKTIEESTAQKQKERKLTVDEIKAQASLTKALRGPTRMYPTPGEKSLEKDIDRFNEAEAIRIPQKNILEQRFALLQNALSKGQTLPTGLVDDAFLPIKELLIYLKPEDANAYKQLENKYRGKDLNQMTIPEQVVFQQQLGALTTQAAIGYAKNLYPVSEKDLEQLFKGFGSGKLTGEALIRLIASQKAADEFADANAKNFSFVIKNDPTNISPRLDASRKSETELKAQNEKLVDREVLKKLYNIDDPKVATNFQLSSAKYYSQLSPTIPKDKEINLFEKLKENKVQDVNTQKAVGDQIFKEFKSRSVK